MRLLAALSLYTASSQILHFTVIIVIVTLIQVNYFAGHEISDLSRPTVSPETLEE